MARATGRRGRRRRGKGSGQSQPRARTATNASASQGSAQPAAQASSAGAQAVQATSATVPPPQTMLRPRREAASTPSVVSAPARRTRRFFGSFRPSFVMNIISELRKVVWPTRGETSNLTMVVIVVSVAVAILLGSVDWGFNRILENVLLPNR